jgi:adenylate cyclase class IV
MTIVEQPPPIKYDQSLTWIKKELMTILPTESIQKINEVESKFFRYRTDIVEQLTTLGAQLTFQGSIHAIRLLPQGTHPHFTVRIRRLEPTQGSTSWEITLKEKSQRDTDKKIREETNCILSTFEPIRNMYVSLRKNNFRQEAEVYKCRSLFQVDNWSSISIDTIYPYGHSFTYIEIESDSSERLHLAIEKYAELLGISPQEASGITTRKLFKSLKRQYVANTPLSPIIP